MKRPLLSMLLAVAGCLLLTAPANAGTFPGGNGRIAFTDDGDVSRAC